MLVTFLVFDKIEKKEGPLIEVSTVRYHLFRQQKSIWRLTFVSRCFFKIETQMVLANYELLIEYYEPCMLFIYT